MKTHTKTKKDGVYVIIIIVLLILTYIIWPKGSSFPALSSTPVSNTPATTVSGGTTVHSTATIPSSTAPGANKAPTSGTPAAPTAAKPVAAAYIIVTDADNNKSVTVPVGSTVAVELNKADNWDLNISNSTIITRSSAPTPAGAQGLYLAARVGQSTLSGVGTQICKPGATCALTSTGFSTTIVVK